MERKTLTVELKADQAGGLRATFSTFNVVDHDGDLTLPSAFEDGAPVRLLPSHDWQHYMIGKGVIRTSPTEATFDGNFFLNTDEGKNWYESIKADMATGNPLQEYSYGFDILDSEPGRSGDMPVRVLKKLKVHEVSPVTLAAGMNTGTIAVKSAPTDEPTELPFIEHAEMIVTEVARFATRAQERGEVLAKEGRAFSSANVTRLTEIAAQIDETSRRLRELLVATEPKQVERAPDELAALYQRFQEQAAYYDRLVGVPA